MNSLSDDGVLEKKERIATEVHAVDSDYSSFSDVKKEKLNKFNESISRDDVLQRLGKFDKTLALADE
ncbi:uncharacterized protein V1516DRAFT_664665, partial [Lipomyces oligophaga]|uniref:uncharacterized protein n=1 Tax=Lipomyces oligophaga TaxID=45792 RepID=UPI0034CDB15F